MFPTNPINALEASTGMALGVDTVFAFPTNPINALEASAEAQSLRRCFWLFPTNPINALEASIVMFEVGQFVEIRFQQIQLTHWKRDLIEAAMERRYTRFPTNPINALEARER